MNPSKWVAAVVVSYDSAEHTLQCLRSLSASKRRPDAIVICENADSAAFLSLAAAIEEEFGQPASLVSGDAPQGVAAQRCTRLGAGGTPLLLLCASDNVGYAGGVNLCIAALGERPWDAVLILNPDTEVDPDALEHLVAYSSNERYGVIGCRLLFARTRRVQMYGCRWRPWIGRVVNIGLDAPADARPETAAVERRIDFVCGAAMYVTRRYFEAVGAMDEAYFLYMEEVDFCFRRGDFRLGYAHDAIVRHAHGATTGAHRSVTKRSPLTIYLGERNKLRFTRKFFPLRYPVVVLTTLCLTLLYWRRSGFQAFRVALAGWRAGVGGETGRPSRAL